MPPDSDRIPNHLMRNRYKGRGDLIAVSVPYQVLPVIPPTCFIPDMEGTLEEKTGSRPDGMGINRVKSRKVE